MKRYLTASLASLFVTGLVVGCSNDREVIDVDVCPSGYNLIEKDEKLICEKDVSVCYQFKPLLGSNWLTICDTSDRSTHLVCDNVAINQEFTTLNSCALTCADHDERIEITIVKTWLDQQMSNAWHGFYGWQGIRIDCIAMM